MMQPKLKLAEVAQSQTGGVSHLFSVFQAVILMTQRSVTQQSVTLMTQQSVTLMTQRAVTLTTQPFSLSQTRRAVSFVDVGQAYNVHRKLCHIRDRYK